MKKMLVLSAVLGLGFLSTRGWAQVAEPVGEQGAPSELRFKQELSTDAKEISLLLLRKGVANCLSSFNALPGDIHEILGLTVQDYNNDVTQYKIAARIITGGDIAELRTLTILQNRKETTGANGEPVSYYEYTCRVY